MKIALFGLLLLILLVGCRPTPSSQGGGPVLVNVATLAPTTPAPTRAVTMTPTALVQSVAASPTRGTPLPVATIDGDFVLVTPTLPPSKTPTASPTHTPTGTSTPLPTATFPPTLTPNPNLILPAPVIGTVDPNNRRLCQTTWFFVQFVPPTCPVGAASSGLGSILNFERGIMVWSQQQDSIYVFYNDPGFPRWQVFGDAYSDGMPDSDPSFDQNRPPNVWQPRRGFGLIWRQDQTLRDRIGWALRDSEAAYNQTIQASIDGVIYIGLPSSQVIGMSPSGNNWTLH